MTELPSGWSRALLSEVCRIVRGVTYNKSQVSDLPNDGMIPVLRANNIQPPTISHDDLVFVSETRVSQDQMIISGDIVIAMSSGSRSVVGKAAQSSSNWNGSFGAFCGVLRPSSEMHNAYVGHFCRSKAYRDRTTELAAGVNINNLKPSHFDEIEIQVPPYAEQASIAKRLDGLLAQVDTLKDRLDALPALIKRFRQSVLNAAASGNLSKDWRTQNPSLTADEMFKDFVPLPEPPRYKTRSDAFISGVCATAVGKPEHRIVPTWAWMPLVQIARMESGHTPSKAVQEYWGGEIPWIGIKDANANHQKTIYKTLKNTNQAGLDNSAARLLPAGTVCVSRTASVGYVVKMGTLMSTSQDFVNWVPTDYIDPEWLKWLFVAEKESLYRFGKGTTHTTIYFPEWLSLHIAVPHIEEQRFIAQRTEQLLKYADGLSARVDDARARVDALTQSILAKAFRGELVPQDPNDEPASVLLERIAAQRAAGPKLKRGRAAKSTS